MKYFIFIFFISCCFGFISPVKVSVQQQIWNEIQLDIEKGLKLCKAQIEDPNICKIDKMHFLITYLCFREDENFRKEIDLLLKKDIECWREYNFYYN